MTENRTAKLDNLRKLSNSLPYWEGLAYGAMSKMFDDIDAKDPLAYKIAYHMQANSQLGYNTDEYKFFPDNVRFPIRGRPSDQAAIQEQLAYEEAQVDAHLNDEEFRHNTENLKFYKRNTSNRYAAWISSRGRKTVLPEDWRFLKNFFSKNARLREQTVTNETGRDERQRLDTLLNTLRCTEDEKKFVYAKTCMMKVKSFNWFVHRMAIGADQQADMLGYLFNFDDQSVKKMQKPDSPLHHIGLFQKEENSTNYVIDPNVYDIITQQANGEQSLLERFVGKPVAAELTLNHYPHYRSEIEMILRIIEDGEKNGEAAKILLYGPAGTGKSQLAALIGELSGKVLYKPGQTDLDGVTPLNREERLANLSVAFTMIKPRHNSMLFSDEIDQLLTTATEEGKPVPSEKLSINTLLEDRDVTLIAAANGTRFDPAYHRRFTYSLRVDPPPVYVRQIIFENIAAQNETNLDQADLKKLAYMVNAAPGIVNTAFRVGNAVSEHGKDKDAFLDGFNASLQSMSRLINSSKNDYYVTNRLSDNFDPSFVTATNNLGLDQKAFEQALRNNRETMQSRLVLHGPKDTGKTEWAKHCSNQLWERDCLIYDLSELRGITVNTTLSNIRDVIEEAEGEHAAVVIDQAGLLINKPQIDAYHFAPAVADLVDQAKVPLIFIQDTSATHKFDIDPVMAIRTDAELQFGYLNQSQIAQGIKLYTGADWPKEQVVPDNVTIPVLRQAARQLTLQQIKPDQPADIVTVIRNVTKSAAMNSKMGF